MGTARRAVPYLVFWNTLTRGSERLGRSKRLAVHAGTGFRGAGGDLCDFARPLPRVLSGALPGEGAWLVSVERGVSVARARSSAPPAAWPRRRIGDGAARRALPCFWNTL